VRAAHALLPGAGHQTAADGGAADGDDQSGWRGAGFERQDVSPGLGADDAYLGLWRRRRRQPLHESIDDFLIIAIGAS